MPKLHWVVSILVNQDLIVFLFSIFIQSLSLFLLLAYNYLNSASRKECQFKRQSSKLQKQKSQKQSGAWGVPDKEDASSSSQLGYALLGTNEV